MSGTHLDKGRRAYLYRQRSAPVNPLWAAHGRTRRMGLDFEEAVRFMAVFRQVRKMALDGIDTVPLLYRFETMPDGHLAVAAYTEALASTRKPGWAE